MKPKIKNKKIKNESVGHRYIVDTWKITIT